MVELLAGPADYRAHHGGAAQRWRARVRFLDRQLRLQAPLRRQASAAGRSQRGVELARLALCVARSRRAQIAPLSKTHGHSETPPRQAAFARRELIVVAQQPRSGRSATVAGIVWLFFLC